MADKDGILDKTMKGVSDAYKSAKEAVSGVTSMGKQLKEETGGVASKAKNVGEYTSGTATSKPEVKPATYDKPINPSAKYGDRPGEKRIDVKTYKDGVKYTPKTGIAKLHEGERVIKKSDNDKLGGMSNMRLVEAALAHQKEEAKEPASEEKKETPAKELKELRIRKTANKGAIIEHHFTQPEFHQMQEHTVANKKQLAQHVMQHMDGVEEGGEGDKKSDIKPDDKEHLETKDFLAHVHDNIPEDQRSNVNIDLKRDKGSGAAKLSVKKDN
jgi:hypothetical protein